MENALINAYIAGAIVVIAMIVLAIIAIKK